MELTSRFLSNFDATGTPILFVLSAAIFVVIVWCEHINSNMKHSLTLPPGPWGVPIIGNLASLHPELHSYFADLARTYGPILKLRLGNKLAVVITSPALARQVLKDNDITFSNRDVPATARHAPYGGADIAFSSYGPTWRMLRKVCVLKMLSNTTMDSVYALRRREIRRTVAYLYSQSGTPVNVGEQMFLTILNTITNMLWGGTMRGEEKEKLGAEFKSVVGQISDLLGKPNISDFFPALDRFDLQGMSKKMNGLANQFDEIFERVIDKRMKMKNGELGEDNDKDFVQFLLQLKDEGDANTPLTMIHIKSLLLDMIVGGSDTSSNSIEFAMAEFLNNPEVMRKAQQELDEVVGKDNIVEEFHINNLPYLQAIMKELLRLHPALPLLIPHCPNKDSIVGDYIVPKGARVFINVWAIQRDPTIWENPLEFKPERFLDGRWDYSGKDFNFFPFGSGRRICAGTAMAERMFMYSLATLLHSFDWKVLQGKKLDLTEKFGIVLKLKNPLVAIPVARLSNPSLYQ